MTETRFASEQTPDAEIPGQDRLFNTDNWKPPKRSSTAVEYENKVASILNGVMQQAAANPATVADAAALIAHAPRFAKAVGDGADQNERIKSWVDFVHSGTNNPYIAIGMTGIPLVLQLLRNHAVQKAPAEKHEVKISRGPFKGRKFRTRFSLKNLRENLKFKRMFTNATLSPEVLADQIFTNPEVQRALKKAGIEVAGYSK